MRLMTVFSMRELLGTECSNVTWKQSAFSKMRVMNYEQTKQKKKTQNFNAVNTLINVETSNCQKNIGEFKHSWRIQCLTI